MMGLRRLVPSYVENLTCPPLIASGTDRELAKYVQFLKEENKVLRSRNPGEIQTKHEERQQLLKIGKSLGRAIEELITIVAASTFYRWCRDDKCGKEANPKGGQREPREIRDLVIEIAKTTGFGYTRIIGEFRKLGTKKISRQTIQNIRKEEGIKPGPERALTTGSECLSKFILFGQQHLDHIVSQWMDYYNKVRFHTERSHLPPTHTVLEEVPKLDRDQIVIRSYVGGLVKSFERIPA